MISKNSECEIFVMRGGVDKDHLRSIHGPGWTLEKENCARRALNVALKSNLREGETKKDK